MALEQMEGFELAGRQASCWRVFHIAILIHQQLRVNTVHEKGTVRYTTQDSLEDSGGTRILSFLVAVNQLIQFH